MRETWEPVDRADAGDSSAREKGAGPSDAGGRAERGCKSAERSCASPRLMRKRDAKLIRWRLMRPVDLPFLKSIYGFEVFYRCYQILIDQNLFGELGKVLLLVYWFASEGLRIGDLFNEAWSQSINSHGLPSSSALQVHGMV